MQVRRTAHRFCLAASLLLLGPWLPRAHGQLLGPEFQVNSYTTSDQFGPAVAADSSGNFVVVWQSKFQDGSGYGVFGQRFNAAGSPVAGEFQVNSYTTGDQKYPAVAVDGSGNFVVAWGSHNNQDGSDIGVFGQRFNSLGSAVGSEFQVNTYTTNSQSFPAVAADGEGNFVVVWNSLDQDGPHDPHWSNYGVFGQRYSSAGTPVGSEFQVNSYTTLSQGGSAVAADSAGNFVVVWSSQDQVEYSSLSIFGQRFNSAGTPVGSEFQVNTYSTGYHWAPAVAADGSGNFVVVWKSWRLDAHQNLFGQRFNSLGSAMGSEFQVNSYTTVFQEDPAVAADGSGNFVVVWQNHGQDGSSRGVFGQRFNSLGSAAGSEFQVNTYTTNSQSFPAVAADGAGNFVVAWGSYNNQDGSGSGVFGQRLPSSITGCIADSETLCLYNNRFEVKATYTDYSNHTGPGHAVALTPDSGYFWFFNASNVEAVGKIHSFCELNGSFGFYAGGMTDVGVVMTVRDTVADQTQTFTNNRGHPFDMISSAFNTCDSVIAPPEADAETTSDGVSDLDPESFSPARAAEISALMQEAVTSALSSPGEERLAPTLPLTATARGNGNSSYDLFDAAGADDGRIASTLPCSPDSTTLCLLGNRFEVKATYTDYSNHTGPGHAEALTPDSGYFWFFSSTNVETVGKIHSFCALNGSFGFYAGGMTDVGVVMTVRDTVANQTQTFTNALGHPFNMISSAFNTCP